MEEWKARDLAEVQIGRHERACATADRGGGEDAVERADGVGIGEERQSALEIALVEDDERLQQSGELPSQGGGIVGPSAPCAHVCELLDDVNGGPHIDFPCGRAHDRPTGVTQRMLAATAYTSNVVSRTIIVRAIARHAVRPSAPRRRPEPASDRRSG